MWRLGRCREVLRKVEITVGDVEDVGNRATTWRGIYEDSFS